MSPKKRVQVNDTAPDFTLKDQDGKQVSLSDFKSKSCVVLYFYPKDNTPGCTAQACAFRDNYEIFQERGATVLGISGDSVGSHGEFYKKHHLPFVILSDTSNKIRKKYGVPSTLGLIPGRVTYIIDKDGTVKHIFNSQFNPQKHIEESLKSLDDLDCNRES